ncbi:MAG: hypothetical protein H7838_01685 [Magnetococcus sp. DMHC-8]
MPQVEIAKMLMAGEQATVVGPGVVKFEAMKLGGAQMAGAAGKAVGAAHVAGNGMVVTSTATASSVPASLLSGKVLGFSLGSLNPWVLLAVGVVGGYMLARKKFPKLIW